MNKIKGQISITILTATVGAIIALSATIYGITVNSLKDTDIRIELKQNQQDEKLSNYQEILGRIDERLANIERAVGVKNKK